MQGYGTAGFFLSYLTIGLFLSLVVIPGPLQAADKKAPAVTKPVQTQILVDTIVASVNGKPITLRQLESRMRSPRQLSLSALVSDPEARYLLDVIVLEQVIQDEAELRKLTASDGEVDRYIEEVAARNNLSRSGFESALQQEGRKIEDLKRQARVEILKSRLTSALMQAGAGVTDQEIKNYIAEHPELSKEGSRVKLSQIFVAFQDGSFDKARGKIEDARSRLQSGDDFHQVARDISESPEGAEGGSLGVLAEKDLSPVMFDTVFSLKDEEISDIVTSERGFHIFKLDERLSESPDGRSGIEEEVRATLEKEKTATRIQNFYTSDIFKKHSIDKKI